MSNIKSKEPHAASATDNSEFTKFTPEQRKRFLSYDFKIDKDFLTNIENNITGIVDLKILDVLFLKNTYGDFKEIKSRFYQKNENGKLYLEQIINHYFEIKKRHKIDGILIQFIIQQKEITLINEDYLLFTKINNNYILPISNFLDTLKQLLYFYNAECEVESNTKPTQQHPQVKPLAEKINWIKEPELLRTHLEKLKEKNFIHYVNPELVMSGDETAVFKKTLYDVAGLFHFWSKAGFIEGYFIKTINQDTNTARILKSHSMIINSFYKKEKGKSFEADSLKANATNPEHISKIESKEKYFESVLL